MNRHRRFTLGALFLLTTTVTGLSRPISPVDPGAPQRSRRRIGFEERVLAQAAIERVYFAHRIGAARSFEEAVPRSLLERKVETYLAESVALEVRWKAPITSEALRRELERIASSTHFPDRLKEIYAALGNDPWLVQETFVRATLADRLARAYFEGGDTAGSDWDRFWDSAERDFDPARAREAAGDLRGLPEPGGNQTVSAGTPQEATATCAFVDAWGHGESEPVPSARTGHSTIWTGSEMIVWGGSSNGAAVNTGSRYDPLTDSWRSTTLAGAPVARFEHAAAWSGSEMIVWGGAQFSAANLTSGGRYDPVGNAWKPTSLTAAPVARTHPSAVWTGREMIVWGGLTNVPVNTGGRYDPANDVWTPTSLAQAPTLGEGHTAVWTGSEMIVWGGGFTSAGGRYDPATDTWRPTSNLDAPVPREGPTSVWSGTEMIVWGGFGGGFAPGGGRYNPVTDTWRATTSVNEPLNRSSHTAVWTGSRMIVWGGRDFSQNPSLGSVNTGGLYDPVADAWMATPLEGAPPPRDRHGAVWTGTLMIVWGGRGDTTGGRYDPATNVWTPTNAARSSPTPRRGHTAVWTGTDMIIWGGGDASGGRYDPLTDTWTPTSTANAPAPRAYHTAVWTGDRMVVWGGEGSTGPRSTGPFATGARYDPAADAWSPTTMLGAPSPRSYHTAVWTGSEMIVWGGDEGQYTTTNTGGRYDPVADKWTATSLAGVPAARGYHTAVWSGRSMIVWGGWDGSVVYASGGRYDPALDVWTPTSLANAPAARGLHTAIWTGRGMIVWGGADASSLLNSGGRYDPVADTWTPTSTFEAPFGRYQHTAVWTGREMIVWGGAYDDGFYVYSTGTGGRYDPVADTWAPTTMTGVPGERDLHTAVWIGGAMIIRGGEINTGDVIYFAHENYVSWYGSAQAIPSPDSDADGYSICAGDCDDAQPSVYPGAPQICGDHLNNDCTDPSWPSLTGTNEADDDGDGITECGGDCDDTNARAWGTPAEVIGLLLEGQTPSLLSWQAAPTGGVPRYDTLRSMNPNDFTAGAVCLESDDPSDMSATDSDAPPRGGIFFYLVRAENSCPGSLGVGPLGYSSTGTPKQGRTCP